MKLLLLSALLLVPTVAFADEPPPPTVVHPKKTVIDFSEVQVSADVHRPAGAYVSVRRRAKFKSLIRVRQGFLPEIDVSATHL